MLEIYFNITKHLKREDKESVFSHCQIVQESSQINIKGIVSRIQQKLEYFWWARNRMRGNQGRFEISLFCFLWQESCPFPSGLSHKRKNTNCNKWSLVSIRTESHKYLTILIKIKFDALKGKWGQDQTTCHCVLSMHGHWFINGNKTFAFFLHQIFKIGTLNSDIVEPEVCRGKHLLAFG